MEKLASAAKEAHKIGKTTIFIFYQGAGLDRPSGLHIELPDKENKKEFPLFESAEALK